MACLRLLDNDHKYQSITFMESQTQRESITILTISKVQIVEDEINYTNKTLFSSLIGKIITFGVM